MQETLIQEIWYPNLAENKYHYAVYCRNCYYLSDYIKSSDPVKGFEVHHVTEKPLTQYNQEQLEKMRLPFGIAETVRRDRKKVTQNRSS